MKIDITTGEKIVEVHVPVKTYTFTFTEHEIAILRDVAYAASRAGIAIKTRNGGTTLRAALNKLEIGSGAYADDKVPAFLEG